MPSSRLCKVWLLSNVHPVGTQVTQAPFTSLNTLSLLLVPQGPCTHSSLCLGPPSSPLTVTSRFSPITLSPGKLFRSDPLTCAQITTNPSPIVPVTVTIVHLSLLFFGESISPEGLLSPYFWHLTPRLAHNKCPVNIY